MISSRLRSSSSVIRSSPPYDGPSTEVVDMLDHALQSDIPPPRSSGGRTSSRNYATTSSAGRKRRRSVSDTKGPARSTFVEVAILKKRQVSKKTTSPHKFKKARFAAEEPSIFSRVARKVAPSTAKIPPAFETTRLKGLSAVGLSVNYSGDGSADEHHGIERTNRAQPEASNTIPDDLEAELSLLSTAENIDFLDNVVRASPYNTSATKTNLRVQDVLSHVREEEFISQEVQSQVAREESQAEIGESSPTPAGERLSPIPGSPQSSSPGRSPSPLLGEDSSLALAEEHPHTIPETAEDQLRMSAGEEEVEDGVEDGAEDEGAHEMEGGMDENGSEKENIRPFDDEGDATLLGYEETEDENVRPLAEPGDPRLPDDEEAEEELDEGRLQSVAGEERVGGDERVYLGEQDQDQDVRPDEDQEDSLYGDQGETEGQDLEEELEQTPTARAGRKPHARDETENGQEKAGDPDYSESSNEGGDQAAGDLDSAVYDPADRESKAEEEDDLVAARDPALQAQEARLEAIVKGADDVLDRDVELSARTIKKLVKTTTEAIAACRRLSEGTDGDIEDEPDEEELEDWLAHAEAIVKRLCSKPLTGERTIVELYAHGIPQLVKLLDALFQHFKRKDVPNFTGLDHLITLGHWILKCYTLASDADSKKSSKSKWTAGYGVVRPVRNDIIPGLRKLCKELKKIRLRREQAVAEERRRKRRELSNQKLDEQAQRKRIEHEEKVRERNRLIAQQARERSKAVFGDRASGAKRVAPAREPLPDTVDYPELPRSRSPSADGGAMDDDEFRSVSADHPPNTRGGIEPAQEEALVEGLFEFQGPTRFMDILRKYGQRGQPLQSWDLDEIFHRAKEIKQNYLDNYEAKPSSKAPAPWLVSV
ncbi:MAG: hypothetical protein M1823_004083 [Watsoniomyces obsoletus]|nr:MAG: hypothetical protein M1823_004083 [Watsoniomyces obsoletus]